MASAAALQLDTTHAQHRGGLHADAAIPISDVVRRDGPLEPDRIALEVSERLRICTHETWIDRSKVWIRNLLYLEGEQNIRWNEGGRRYLRKSPARDRDRVSNRLSAMLFHQAAKLVQGRPGFTAMPENRDLDRRRGAKATERILLHDWRELKLGPARFMAIIDCLAIGIGFIEVGYNPRGGNLVIDYEYERTPSGEVVRDQMGTPVRRFDGDEPAVRGYRWEGAFYGRVRSPFSVFVPPSVEQPVLEDCPYVITTDWMGEEQIRAMLDLPKDFKFGPPDPEIETVEPVTSFFQRFATTRGVHPRIRSGQQLVIRYHERATDVRGFEHGKVYWVVGRKLLKQTRAQLDDGRFQLFAFPWKPRRGQFFPHAFLTDLIDPQTRYNQGLSHGYTWMGLFANPNVLVPRNSGIPQDIAFNFRRYEFNPQVGPPIFWTPPAPSNAIFTLMDRTVTDLSSIASQSPFSRGEPVPGVPAAKYVQLMQDADAQEMGPILATHALAWEALGGTLADLHAKYDSDERLLAVVGRANRPELRSFRRADLPGRSKVWVQESSMFSVMPSARIEQVEKLANTGFFGAFADAPVVRRKLLEWIRMPDLLDIDPPDEQLNAFLQETTARVVEEGEDVTIPPWAEQPLVAALKGALLERLINVDAFDMDQETVARVMAWKEQLDAKLAEFQQQEEATETKQREDLFGMQARGELLKSSLRTRERILGEVAKAGATVLSGKGQQPAGGKPPDSGGKKAGSQPSSPSVQ